MNEPSDLLKSVRGSLEFQAVMIEMAKKRPLVAPYRLCETHDEEQAMFAQMRVQTGQQMGFDMLYFALTGKSL